MEDSTGVNRRHVIAGAAVVGVACPLLAACGSDGGGGGGGSTAEAGTVLAPTSDVPVGGGTVLSDKRIVLTQPEEGTFKAFSATCTHQGCVVASVSETINCDCHGSRYSITDGSVENGPATSPLEEQPITVEGGEIKAGGADAPAGGGY